MPPVGPILKTLKIAVKNADKAVKAAKKFWPVIIAGVKVGKDAYDHSKNTYHEFKQFRESTRDSQERKPTGLRISCIERLGKISPGAKDMWCIGRLGELCFICHRKVDAFGQPINLESV